MGLSKCFVIHPEKCTGCGLCELICSFSHEGIFQPFLSRIKIKMFSKEGISIPRVCIKCDECLCIDACGEQAILKNKKTGATEVDQDKCVGCTMCIGACPYYVMYFNPNSEKAYTCDLCGGDPQCVKYCFTKAIEWVDVEAAPFARTAEYLESLKSIDDIRKILESKKVEV